MNGLLPIIRRKRRPLIEVDAQAVADAPSVQPVVVLPVSEPEMPVAVTVPISKRKKSRATIPEN